MKQHQYSGEARAHTTATTTEQANPTRQELDSELLCMFLSLNDPNRALMMRLMRAVATNDTEALQAIKADSPAICADSINSLIAESQGVQS